MSTNLRVMLITLIIYFFYAIINNLFLKIVNMSENFLIYFITDSFLLISISIINFSGKDFVFQKINSIVGQYVLSLVGMFGGNVLCLLLIYIEYGHTIQAYFVDDTFLLLSIIFIENFIVFTLTFWLIIFFLRKKTLKG
jgi:hypothetical protein